jgi:hypothetical protein
MSQAVVPPKLLQKAVFTGFFFLLLVGGILFFALPKELISENEKRALAPFPHFYWESLVSGRYTDSIDQYYSDHFAFRNHWIAWAKLTRKYQGIKNENMQLYTRAQKPSGGTTMGKLPNEAAGNGPDTTMGADSNGLGYELINSVIVHNKKAIQIFSGSFSIAGQFTRMIHQYRKELGPQIGIQCMTIPVGSDFYVPLEYNPRNNREKVFIDYIYRKLDPSIVCIPVYDSLARHQSEYIQFNTDHHWTGLAAYYAYVAYCKSLGMHPIPKDSLQRKVIRNFLGTLYQYTLSEDLKTNLDSVECFKIPQKPRVFTFDSLTAKPKPGRLYADFARGPHAYSIFLGGDFPMLKMISPVKSGRKILMLKDSYGNAFAPFLAAHYEEVWVLDYRYFNGNVKEIIRKNGITDILFAHNVFVANNRFTMFRETKFLHWKASKPKSLSDSLRIPFPSTKPTTDSLVP